MFNQSARTRKEPVPSYPKYSPLEKFQAMEKKVNEQFYDHGSDWPTGIVTPALLKQVGCDSSRIDNCIT
jgi:hypothetical protein